MLYLVISVSVEDKYVTVNLAAGDTHRQLKNKMVYGVRCRRSYGAVQSFDCIKRIKAGDRIWLDPKTIVNAAEDDELDQLLRELDK